MSAAEKKPETADERALDSTVQDGVDTRPLSRALQSRHMQMIAIGMLRKITKMEFI